MRPSDFKPSAPGTLVAIGPVREGGTPLYAFVPHRLPPGVGWLGEALGAVQGAALALGELKGLASPHSGVAAELLLGPLSRREAVLSSRIEGTTASVDQVSQFEADAERVEQAVPDVREVANYAAAMNDGFDALREHSKISLMLVRQIHRRLLRGVDDNARPGEFREGQVVIGSRGSAPPRFVPPPHVNVRELMENLVEFMNDSGPVPPLVAVAMAHYQFETIHPFREGNGRVGRILIALHAARAFGFSSPLLQLSPFFESDRREYYDQLLDMSHTGDWTGWVRYVLAGVEASCRDTIRRYNRLRDVHAEYVRRLMTGRAPAVTLRLIDLIFRHPTVSVRMVAEFLPTTRPTAALHLGRLVKAGIVAEVTGRTRDRLFQAEQILSVVREGLRD